MDNLTHTLIGIVAGDVIARNTADVPGGLSASLRRSYFVTVAAISSNIPDIDLLVTYGGFAPGKVGYLLHHRGHTHTIIGCVLLALLLYACALLWARRRRHTLARRDRIGIGLIAAFGALLHLFMDWLNSYGVHPYWPFDDGWVYGDSVFIIEPLYWLSLAPLIFTVRTWLARIVLSFALLAALGLGVYVNRDLPIWIGLMVLAATALLIVGRRCSARTASVVSAVAVICVTGMFVGSGRATAREVVRVAATTFPGERTADHVLTPLPTNPLCWNVLLIQTEGDRYIVRSSTFAAAPAILSAEHCPQLRFLGAVTAPLREMNRPSTARVQWQGELSVSREHLASVIRENCEALELMQFARAPYLVEEARHRVLGDLRFDREEELGFAEIELTDPPPSRCVFNVPWIPPRAAEFGLSSAY